LAWREEIVPRGSMEAGACASRARLTIRPAEVEAVEIDLLAFVGTGRGH
jgi:hypothetical protein